jgi:hypothetical protein
MHYNNIIIIITVPNYQLKILVALRMHQYQDIRCYHL